MFIGTERHLGSQESTEWAQIVNSNKQGALLQVYMSPPVFIRVSEMPSVHRLTDMVAAVVHIMGFRA